MPLVYLVVDHWSTVVQWLFEAGIRRFFVTRVNDVKAFVDRGCDVIVDNGAYRLGRPSFAQALLAARMGLKYVLPDAVGDPRKTFELHMRFADAVSERELSNGFVVLQGSTVDENIEWLEEYARHGLVKKYVAFGGPRELRRRRSVDEKIVTELHRYCSKRGLWLHVLGRSRRHCDSFDTSSWSYRLLDQKLKGERYSIEPVINMVRKYECGE